MIVNWNIVREESPITTQLIEKQTGFKYSVPYKSLIHEVTNDLISYANLEGFFDDHGWKLTILPLDHPNWNGVISDTNGKMIFNNIAQFEGVVSRNHAKSLLAGIAIQYFEKTVAEIMKLPEGCLVLLADDIRDDAKGKTLEQYMLSDLTLDASGLVEHSNMAVIKIDGKIKVLKNTQEMPPIGLILNV